MYKLQDISTDVDAGPEEYNNDYYTADHSNESFVIFIIADARKICQAVKQLKFTLGSIWKEKLYLSTYVPINQSFPN